MSKYEPLPQFLRKTMRVQRMSSMKMERSAWV